MAAPNYRRVVVAVQQERDHIGGNFYPGTRLPPGFRVESDTGFNGHVGSAYLHLDEGESMLVAGIRVRTTSGEFEVIGGDEATEDPEVDLKFECFRIFDNQADAQSKWSTSPQIELTDGVWSGTVGAALENPVLLTPGNYRIDFTATASEDYEFGSVAAVELTIVVVKFREHYFIAPNGVKGVGMESFTSFDLETGSAGIFPYEFPGDDAPPIAVDIQTFRMSLVDWAAYLLARAIGGIPNEHRRSHLTTLGYIENFWTEAITTLPGYGVEGYSGETAGGGAIDNQQTVKEAIGRILFELGAFFDWTGPTARIIPIPRSKPAYIRLITLDDIEAPGAPEDMTPNLSITYSDESDVVNTIDARYLRDYSQDGSFDAYRAPLSRRHDEPSVGALGERMDQQRFWFDWGRDAGSMADVVDTWRTHLGSPKKLVEFTGYLDLLELQRGDVIAFDLRPITTIGPSEGTPDENQGYGEGGYGDGGYGGQPIIPDEGETIIGEKFDGLTPNVRFMIQSVAVNWAAKRVQISAREVP